jgi:DNA polymerase elongation subunit (family B)
MKILFYDLENVAGVEFPFHRGNVYKKREKGFCGDLAYILNFGFKWLDGSGGVLIPEKSKFKTFPHDLKTIDYELCKSAIEIIQEADVVVTWYGSGHDEKFLRARAAKHGLVLPDIKHIDLWRVYSSKFPMASNSLNAAAKFFDLPINKLESDMLWWPKCQFGDVKALDEMSDYCYRDVVVLEEMYKKLLPHIKGMPQTIGRTHDACTNCNSLKTQKRGTARTKCYKYIRRQCFDCGTWFKGEMIK